MNELWKTFTDPRVSVVAVLTAVVAAGFGALWLGYRSVLGMDLVPFQVPYLVSAGLTGLALIGGGLGLLSVHLDRVNAIEERRQLAELRRAIRARRDEKA